MDLRIGYRCIAVVPGEGEVEVTLVDLAPGELLREGGGDTYVPHWRVRRDDGFEFDVGEPALKALPSEPPE